MIDASKPWALTEEQKTSEETKRRVYDPVEAKRRTFAIMNAERYGSIFGLRRGEWDARAWLTEAKKRHAAYVESLDTIAMRLIPNVDELDFFRAFHDDYVERYPDMEMTDRTALDQFLERAEKRLKPKGTRTDAS